MIESVIAVIVNLLLPYLVLSLLAMLIVELIAALLQLRARTLKAFIQRMLDDPKGSGIARDFYRHHLIASLSLGKSAPSYIPARLFSTVLMETIGTYADDGALDNKTQRLPNPALRKALRATTQRWPGQEQIALELWYNQVMDGASGVYRLRTLFILAIVATLIVLPVNLDAIRISDHVARRSLVEKMLELRIQTAMKVAQEGSKGTTPPSVTLPDLPSLQALAFPIGWSGERAEWRLQNAAVDSLVNYFLLKVVGLLTSILAIMIGAPFLFDFLNRFMIVRSTVKPGDIWVEPQSYAVPAPAVMAVPSPRSDEFRPGT